MDYLLNILYSICVGYAFIIIFYYSFFKERSEKR